MNGPFHLFLSFRVRFLACIGCVWFGYAVDTVMFSRLGASAIQSVSNSDDYLYVYEYPRKDQR
jgi:hypothetical protein